jgi:ferric-dicitrate binding protein FerR (iron transport regulator)
MESKHPLDELWPVLDPPAGFGERVLQALEKTPAAEPLPVVTPPELPPRRARRPPRGLWLASGVCAGAVAAGALMSFWPSGDGKSGDAALSGHLIADIRQTLPIGDRGLAVAERGAELAWFVVAGNPRVEQPRGSVFYRIDRGGPFTVATPVGDVRVTGTCFRVTVEPDGDERPAMVAMVEVLEGTVLLAGSRGELGLSAGEKGRMTAYASPVRVDPDLGAATRRRPEIEARVRQLEQALSDARRAAAREDDPLGAKVYDLTPEDRRALARRCEMRYYLPRHLTGLDAPSLDESLALSPDQRAAVMRLMEDHRSQYLAALQSLYIEVTGDEAIALRLAPKGLQEELYAKLGPQDLKDARRHILEEWEQGAPLPGRGPRGPAERFMRLVSGAGEAFFRQLVDLVGPERARQIRSKTTSDSLTFSPAYECGSRRPKRP